MTISAAYSLPAVEVEKTTLGLANWAINAYNENWGYSKGYYGQIITQDNLSMYADLYPDYYTSGIVETLTATIPSGKRYADCIGLVKGYFWYNSDDIIPNFSIFPDTSAEDLFANAKNKGSITSMPDIPGIVVYDANTPHIGIYVGNGMVIDDRNPTTGIHYSNLSSFTWTNYIMLEQLDYDTYNDNISNATTLFGRQLESISNGLSFLPDDIVLTMIVIIAFLCALGLIRIVL